MLVPYFLFKGGKCFFFFNPFPLQDENEGIFSCIQIIKFNVWMSALNLLFQTTYLRNKKTEVNLEMNDW